MRIKKQKNVQINKKLIVIILCIILTVFTLFAWFSPSVPFFGIKESSENEINYSKPSKLQKQTGEDIKKDTAPSSIIDTKKNGIHDVESVEEVVPFSVSFTSLNISKGVVTIRTLIDAVNSSGVCTLTLSKNEIDIVKKADIQAGPSSSTCMGFDIPVSELTQGEWQVSVSVVINGQKAYATQTLTL